MGIKYLLSYRVFIFLFFTVDASSGSAQLTAAFSADTIRGCSPLVVHFKDESSGNPTSWRWDLGNGTSSTLQNPAATYFKAGTYSVKLIVTNGVQADSVVKINYITVDASPVVNFKASDTSGCFPLRVQFTDLSTPVDGSITSWEWDFGDGSSSSEQHPHHVYTELGFYNVSLRIYNSRGCHQTLTRINYIKLTQGIKPAFDFTGSNNCNPPTPVRFTNFSAGTGSLSFLWDFGDGSTSTESNPTHLYNTSGTFTIKLTVRNNFGCVDSIVKPNALTVGSVVANFVAPSLICAGTAFSLNNISSPSPVGAWWDFGDGTTSSLIHPVKSFSNSGTYVIKLVSDFGVCKDSITKPLQVSPGPTADFIASNRMACKSPHTVSFAQKALNGVSYKWLFGDGDSSTLPDPVHTYVRTGEFDVTLIVANTLGCIDTLVIKKYVRILPPNVFITNVPQEGCVPFTFQPQIVINSPDSIVSFQWDFGDGYFSFLRDPSHTYTTPGTYDLVVVYRTAGGCVDTTIVEEAIRIGEKPLINFNATPRFTCAFRLVNFNDLSTGPKADKWLWHFGDGGTSTLQNPSHIYQDTGYFTVKLIVWNNGCKDSLILPNYVYIQPPIAKFVDSFACTSPFTRWFLDRSIGATSWYWDFGDNNTSTEKNPMHTYSAKGEFTVKLTVRNDTCEHITNKTIVIVSEKADFVASDTMVCKGAIVNFSTRNVDSLNIIEYIWDFGDGSIQSGSNSVQHIYAKAGDYPVKLVVVDINGCRDTLFKPLYIHVYGPEANFISSSPTVCTNAPITFTDESASDGVHPIRQWIWNYGDGIVDTLTTPPFQHSYSNPGRYNVVLKVIDSKSCVDSITKFNFITISKPSPRFISPDTISCPNKTIRFINQSSGNTLTYQWKFGDGQTSSIFEPIHSYPAEGSYAISLLATDRFGCTDSITKLEYIKIRSPRASFNVSDSVATCPPLVVNFTNQSQNFSSYQWDFGDGTGTSFNNPSHFYTYPGSYRAKLTIISPGGCIDTISKLIVVRGPQGDFTYNKTTGCEPTTVRFVGSTKDNASFVWDFNDGTIAATGDSILSHTYDSMGVYLPKMILVDPQGCRVPILGRDTIRIFGVQAKFSINKQILCDSGLVQFTDLSVANDPITRYEWLLGDGSTSTSRNPLNFYRQTGNYPVQLIATTRFGCTDTAELPVPIKVSVSPVVEIRGDSTGCIPFAFQLEGLLLRNDTSALQWQWNFDNGTSANIQNPPQITYTNPGSYNVRLVVVNSSGCADTARRRMEAFPIPNVDAGANQIICRGAVANLSASGAIDYQWTPNIALSCTSCSEPLATPLENITYYLVGKNIFGCNASDSVTIEVKQPFKMHVAKGDTLCTGETFQLFATGAERYIWNPVNGLDDPRSARPKAKPDASVTYRVIGSDNQNCFSDTNYIPLVVYPYPSVDAGNDKTLSAGTTVELTPLLSSDVIAIKWLPPFGLNCGSCPHPVATPKQTTTYKIEVANEGGCISSDEITLSVFCDNSNLFMPNTFSPNSDGNNDVFYPRGKGLFTIKTFQIFNRWGEIVFEGTNFEANDMSKGWNGVHKGKPAPEDVYVYTIDVICDNKVILNYRGNIALIR